MIPISTHTAFPRRASQRLVSGVATLVLSLATGTPLRSAAHLLPHSGEQGGPYLGV